jgi:hypothetical protein
MPDVSEAALAVVQETQDAGVFVFAGGLPIDPKYDVVATDGAVTDGPYPESKEFIGGCQTHAPCLRPFADTFGSDVLLWVEDGHPAK